jgi:uncharacterized protein (TIGR03067 family)
MWRTALALALLAVPAAAIVGAPALKDRKPDDAARIVGVWSQESLSLRGQEPMGAQRGTFRFDKDGTCVIGNANGSEFPVSRYTLDPASSPRRMKWLNGPELTEWHCLYEFDGDRLKVAFVDQGTEAPKKIEPTKNLTIYYLKRVKE